MCALVVDAIVFRSPNNQVNRCDITTGLANAHLAFEHFIYFDINSASCLHANNPDQKIICEHVLGTLMPPVEALRFCMFLDRPSHSCVESTPVTQVQRNGEALPVTLQCWMVKGSRPSILPSQASQHQLIVELKRNELPVDGDLKTLIERCIRHDITIRKPAHSLSLEECSDVIRSRDASRAGKTVAELQEQVARMYETEDTPGYGPPRLKDPSGISLFQHLLSANLVTMQPQHDPNLAFPREGWISAGGGIPLSMEVVRAYFQSVGEALTGDYKTRQMKEGWARIKNRTALINFGYCGPSPKPANFGSAPKANEQPPQDNEQSPLNTPLSTPSPSVTSSSLVLSSSSSSSSSSSLSSSSSSSDSSSSSSSLFSLSSPPSILSLIAPARVSLVPPLLTVSSIDGNASSLCATEHGLLQKKI